LAQEYALEKRWPNSIFWQISRYDPHRGSFVPQP
jgi:hypothetical protein